MASGDKYPSPMPASGTPVPPGEPMTVGQHILDEGAAMVQSLKPIKQMNQHVCTFAIYAHDMSRQIETHHYVTRLNKDFLQCAVYDSDDSTGRLLGVEYIVSDRIFDALPPDEQKLWHSHAYEVKSGLWVNPRIPEMVARPELENLAKSYGKFWCTWQIDRGDVLPVGAPALMMSPQGVSMGTVKPELVQKRDNKYNISTEALRMSRVEIDEPEWINPQADYWKQHGKGFAIDIHPTELKLRAPFP
ncbi:oil body-associated protein 2C [Ziziphus jujuba]|uniref:Oil body-associated protein 2C n=1 Tax=Ziziphus jujuba TaxID=326968 RepID=A0A6P3ZRL4_ZIZJJ|nr:oil body-associated protein 2C [Ziziphus jujuba]